MTKHSLLPWYTDETVSSLTAGDALYAANDDWLGDIAYSEDAAFIVYVANCHDELVTALEQADEAFEYVLTLIHSDTPKVLSAHRYVKDALRNAKAKKQAE